MTPRTIGPFHALGPLRTLDALGPLDAFDTLGALGALHALGAAARAARKQREWIFISG
jgi:hypothetical protein